MVTCPAVPGAGIYKVDLLNEEPWWTSAGSRLFSVEAEGVTQFPNLDLFVQAGGKNKATNNTFLTKARHFVCLGSRTSSASSRKPGGPLLAAYT